MLKRISYNLWVEKKSSKSFIYFPFSCVDNNDCGDILDVRNNLVCDNKAEQTCCHESKIKIPDYDLRAESITCPEIEDEGYR